MRLGSGYDSSAGQLSGCVDCACPTQCVLRLQRRPPTGKPASGCAALTCPVEGCQSNASGSSAAHAAVCVGLAWCIWGTPATAGAHLGGSLCVTPWGCARAGRTPVSVRGRARRPFCVGYVTQSGQQQQSVKRLEVDPSGCFAGVGPAGRIKHHLFWPRTFFGA